MVSASVNTGFTVFRSRSYPYFYLITNLDLRKFESYQVVALIKEFGLNIANIPINFIRLMICIPTDV